MENTVGAPPTIPTSSCSNSKCSEAPHPQNNYTGVPPAVVPSETSAVVAPAIPMMMMMDDEEAYNKRTALAGQWRTPPTAFFPSGTIIGTTTTEEEPPNATSRMEFHTTADADAAAAAAAAATNTRSVVKVEPMEAPLAAAATTTGTAVLPPPTAAAALLLPVPAQLPHSAEDYAKALQEAYCRGAEAAARAAAQHQLQMAATASCPEFPVTAAGAPVALISSNSHTTNTNIHPMPMATSSPAFTTTTIASSSSINVPATNTTEQRPVLPPFGTPHPQHHIPMSGVQLVHHHHHQQQQQPMAAPVSNPTVATQPPESVTSSFSNSNTAATNHPFPGATALPPTASTTPASVAFSIPSSLAATAALGFAPVTASQQQRSVSMPDMSSYAVLQEEEKRQKRLARNRASARLRRLRKKNLVDAYETEVGSLENTIQQLQQHEWGATTTSSSALAEALSMDRGQQKLTATERCQAATDILTQQLQFLQQLEEIMQEQYVLQQMASCCLAATESANVSHGGTHDDNNNNNNDEWKDLQDTLQLTSTQCQELVQSAAGWQDEWNALQTVKASLLAMKENDWLWNEGCSAITDQFMAILHKNQISKFLLWTDHNAETIEELDGVHAINAVQDAPIFQFGVDSSPNEGLDEEKMG